MIKTGFTSICPENLIKLYIEPLANSTSQIG